MFLYKNQSNTVALTLNEKATNTTYDVLFKFVHETSKKVLYFTATDESLVSRYNKFTIIETSSQNVYQGRIELEKGQYRYTVYEMPVASPKSLDPDNSVGTLETGRVTVYEADTETTFDPTESETPSFE